MSDQLVSLTFDALYALTDLRELWRKTAPFHRLDETTKKKAIKLLERAQKDVNRLLESLSTE
jgi:hypothetical protein